MKFFDILKMAFHNLWQRKLRVTLNLIGIVTGCIILLMTAAGGRGVQQAILTLFDSSDFARQVEMMSNFTWESEAPDDVVSVKGDMSETRRKRIEEFLAEEWQHENSKRVRKMIDGQIVDDLKNLEHVDEVVPELSFLATAAIGKSPKHSSYCFSASLTDQNMKQRILAGEMLDEDDEDKVMIHEYLAYKLGYRDDKKLNDLIGQEITIEYQKQDRSLARLFQMLGVNFSADGTDGQVEALGQLGEIAKLIDSSKLTKSQKAMVDRLLSPTKKYEQGEKLTQKKSFTIKAVFKQDAEETMFAIFRRLILDHNGQIAIHSNVTRDIMRKNNNLDQYSSALVKVDSAKHLAEVVEVIEGKGLRAYSALPILEQVEKRIGQISWALYGIAAAILLIAAIGISNTLIISVLQRTQELGIMKALGASDGQVLLLMIFEGVLLGVLGVLIAFALSNIFAIFGSRFLESYVESRIDQDLSGSLFSFSWATLGIVAAITISICSLASLFPAIRAARLDPIVAMRRN